MPEITISEIMNGAWRDRAIYTAEERGIPAFADGLKPVQRFLVCKALQMARTKFEKVATIATVATVGYHHGEASAAAALTSMAADFSNNLPIFEGDGNFGNVLNPSAGAPRYIYARLAPYFDSLFKDMDLCPKHDDPEHVPPKYYLPIIPLVLVNGIKGIATGYATDIPPHDPISIIDALIARCKNKPMPVIKPKYYAFSGIIDKGTGCYNIHGTYELNGANKIHVTELPRGYTCASYDNHLKKLQDKGIIVDYENNSRMNKFDYIIILKKGTRWDDTQIRKNLKLDTSHTWNLTTVNLSGRIQDWDKNTGIEDLMECFYQFRLQYIFKRIRNKCKYYTDLKLFQEALKRFCQDIIDNKFSFKGLEDSAFKQILLTSYQVPENHVQQVMNMPVRAFTVEMIAKLDKELLGTLEKLKYYEQVTPQQEYINDLTELKKQVKLYEAENN